jgi:hypothetical protein
MLEDSALNLVSGTAGMTAGGLGLGAKVIRGGLGASFLGRTAQGSINGAVGGLVGGAVGAGITPVTWSSGKTNGVLEMAQRGILGVTTGAVTGGALTAVKSVLIKPPEPTAGEAPADATEARPPPPPPPAPNYGAAFLQVMSGSANHMLHEDPAFQKNAAKERTHLAHELDKVHARQIARQITLAVTQLQVGQGTTQRAKPMASPVKAVKALSAAVTKVASWMLGPS